MSLWPIAEGINLNETSGGIVTLTFCSILFEHSVDSIKEQSLEAPAFFADLNLDQIIEAITASRQDYNLKPFFYASPCSIDTIKYRHEIMQDLENPDLVDTINTFSQEMRIIRQHLALVERLNHRYNKEGWFLEAVAIYCEAIQSLAHDLTPIDIKSRGFSAFREYLTNYAESDHFTSLQAETDKLKADLSSVKYCLRIKGRGIQVRAYDSEIDYSTEVEKTFERFKQGAVKDYRVKFYTDSDMNHVESKVLDLVARLYPDIFSNLDTYCSHNTSFLDERIVTFDREIQFYLAYLEHMARFKQAGLNFCYPQISLENKEVYDYEGFDLALANKLISEKSSVVCNDFQLQDKERIIVVTGPNQGGKTTFARTFGQLHYLAGLGFPVPGRKAQLFLFDRIFTHFEKEENIDNLRGKLQDELIRIHDILDQATTKSIIIMNEILSSTTVNDSVRLGKKILEKIIELDLLCVCVTFFDELSSLGEKTVSMVSTIAPENPALRTYKIVRRPADGLSYALSIAEKYKLTYDRLKERLKS